MYISRDEKQLEIVELWRDKMGRGTLIAPTGFGKTRTSFIIIKKLKAINIKKKIIVIVPTLNLKQQWEQELIKSNLSYNVEVYVVNTAIKILDELSCDLLILDEVHAYGGDKFKKIFTLNTVHILGLTATLEEDSTIFKIVNAYCPVFETVSLEDCRKNKWISDYQVYNLEIEFTEAEAKLYKDIQREYEFHQELLGGRFEAFRNAISLSKTGSSNQRRTAFLFLKAIRKRKNLLYNSSNKLRATKKILETFKDKKALVFTESIEFAECVYIGNLPNCVLYHSKQRKTEQELSLARYKDPKDSVRAVISVRGLNAGFDDEETSLGIITSGNSKKLHDVQRTGRIIRKHGDKNAIIINLYIPDTQELIWLNKRQKNVTPKWIKSIEEIV